MQKLVKGDRNALPHQWGRSWMTSSFPLEDLPTKTVMKWEKFLVEVVVFGCGISFSRHSWALVRGDINRARCHRVTKTEEENRQLPTGFFFFLVLCYFKFSAIGEQSAPVSFTQLLQNSSLGLRILKHFLGLSLKLRIVVFIATWVAWSRTSIRWR